MLVVCSVALLSLRSPSAYAQDPTRAARLLAATDTTLHGWMASDAAALALGIPLLRRVPFREGEQEIRIWSGVELGEPRDLVRLHRRGRAVSGTWAWYWSADDASSEVTTDAVVRHSLAGRCDTPRQQGDTAACVARLRSRPDWSAIWDSLTVLGVWTLPNQDDLPHEGRITLDGWSMTIELRDGPRYRSVAYSNPDAFNHPAQVAATAVGGAARHLGELLPPPRNERQLRGELHFGSAGPEFRSCRSSTVWGVQGPLGPVLDSARAASQRSATSISFLVNLRGMLTVRGLARSWGAPYDYILQVDTVSEWEQWSARKC